MRFQFDFNVKKNWRYKPFAIDKKEEIKNLRLFISWLEVDARNGLYVCEK
jgi:hypothetical protein